MTTIELNTNNKLEALGVVILAGGQARRMGGIDKGLVLVAGRPMVQHVVDTLKPLVSNIVINANRNRDVYEQFGYPVVEDQFSGHLGPLAGLSAAIKALNTPYVMMCPCDSPFIQTELVASLYETCCSNDADIAVAHDGARLQPVFCVVNRRVETSLDQFITSGERKIDKWFGHHQLVEVEAASCKASFKNINTEEERLAAESELGFAS